jgi:hypothetical protein
MKWIHFQNEKCCDKFLYNMNKYKIYDNINIVKFF